MTMPDLPDITVRHFLSASIVLTYTTWPTIHSCSETEAGYKTYLQINYGPYIHDKAIQH
jgi:hypothetical protein